jgi:hypothetical protein
MSSSGIVTGYGCLGCLDDLGCLGRPLGVVLFMRSILRCRLRSTETRADGLGGVDVAARRLGALYMATGCTVRYASTGDEAARKGCWSGAANVKGTL